jgi:hypothetical protein
MTWSSPEHPRNVYEGEWENNQRHGNGTMRYVSGNVYEGQWENHQRYGIGTMFWNNRGERYSGEWVRGKMHGHGLYEWTINCNVPHRYPYRHRYIGMLFFTDFDFKDYLLR